MPYFKSLADTYSMSDNFHQSVEAARARTTSCSATAMPSGSAMATATQKNHPTM